MRELVRTLAARLVEFGGTGDPFTLWRPLEAELPAVLDEAARHLRIDAIPPLAGLLALGAIDNALHDAWSRTAGQIGRASCRERGESGVAAGAAANNGRPGRRGAGHRQQPYGRRRRRLVGVMQ